MNTLKHVCKGCWSCRLHGSQIRHSRQHGSPNFFHHLRLLAKVMYQPYLSINNLVETKPFDGNEMKLASSNPEDRPSFEDIIRRMTDLFHTSSGATARTASTP
ncbi:UNVERIFIED_CONTAM: hypothetical protein Sradi_5664100 [Sesamum radiatum]|uniref:Uncharacterized protein n=1 Tax=Sesamum radiatum TaxID=300843 RepID=A0AAW2L1D6_SESRA